MSAQIKLASICDKHHLLLDLNRAIDDHRRDRWEHVSDSVVPQVAELLKGGVIEGFTLEIGDCRDTMRRWAQQGVKAQTCVTSPPYFGLRDYGVDGQLGLEQTPEQYIAAMVEVFRCVRDVLADDGTLWLNIGDSYARPLAKGGSGPGGKNREWYGENYGSAGGAGVPDGLKPKDLIGVPWMLAFALRADGWYLRQDIIWHKPNPMPESVRDRCTKAHEYVFLLSKSEKYFFDSGAIREPEVCGRKRGPALHPDTVSTNGNSGLSRRESDGFRNRRDVWTVATSPYKGAHFATYPPALIEPCILAGSRPGDIVLDPFGGSGTTAQVALQHGRRALLCELNPAYAPLIEQRVGGVEFAESLPAMHPTLVPKFHAFLRRIQEGIAA